MYQWITADGIAIYAGEYQDTVGTLFPDSSYDAEGFLFSEMLYATSLEYTLPYNSNSMKITSIPARKKKNGEPFPSFIISGDHLATDSLGYPDYFRSGYPFPYRPDSIRGYYMFSDSLSAIDNWGKVLLFLKKYDPQSGQTDTIAYLNSTLDLSPGLGWRPFSIAIPYLSSAVPDSLALSFFSSAIDGAFGVLWLDELEFVYGSASASTLPEPPKVRIYPNPGRDLIRIKAEGIAIQKLSILDLGGRRVWTGSFDKAIPVSELARGMYFIEIWEKNGGHFTQKWIKN